MRLYHGTGQETPNGLTLYFTPDIEVARQFALSLDDCGNHNEESLIYYVDVPDTEVDIEDDFDYFDGMAYSGDLTNIVMNPETNWYIVPNVHLTLLERYPNNL